ncbi:hypothetical protein BJX76DRAFT_319685 [Aspergillus varians]
MCPDELKAQAPDFVFHWVTETGETPATLTSNLNVVPTVSQPDLSLRFHKIKLILTAADLGLLHHLPPTRHRHPRRRQIQLPSQRHRKGLPSQDSRVQRCLSLRLWWIRTRSFCRPASREDRYCAAVPPPHAPGGGAIHELGREEVCV